MTEETPPHRIKWDHYFAQWHACWLPTFQVTVEAKPRFSELPLEADLLVIILPDLPTPLWKQHPLWQYFSPHTLIEFKSVHDPFETQDFATLIAYVALTQRKYKLSPDREIAGWLLVPKINHPLRTALQAYGIELHTASPGIHLARTQFFPLMVVEYDLLPNTKDFFDLKIFLNKKVDFLEAVRIGGKELKQFKDKDRPLIEEYIKILSVIHPEEAEEMVEILEEDLPGVIHFAKVVLNRLDKKGLEEIHHEYWPQLEEQARKTSEHNTQIEIARQMKAKGFEVKIIAELTGLSVKEIAKL